MAVQSLMSTKIAIDTLEASTSIKNLQSVVRAMSSEWQSQSKAQEMAGDSLGALETKYSGLGRAMEAQRAKIDALKQKQSEITDTTQKGAEQYLKYERQIAQASAQLAKMEQQQGATARSLEYHKSGLAQLQESYRTGERVASSYIERLRAEGRESEANSAKQNSLKQSIANLSKQYGLQSQELNKLKSSTNASNSEIAEQEIRLNRTATSLAKAKTELNQVGKEVTETTGAFGKLKSHLGTGVLMGIGQSAWQSLTGYVSGLKDEVLQTSDSIQKFQNTMKFGGFGNKEIKEATKDFKEYADKTVYELNDVYNTGAQLASNGIKNYQSLTKAAGNLNAVAGGNADTFKSLGMVLTQTAGAGKLTTENWNQLTDAIPGASGKLQEAMRKNGAFTGNFRDAMAKGEISAKELFTAIEQLGNTKGAEKAAKSTSTFEGAMGNLKSTVVSGANDIIQAIGKDNITGAINSVGKAMESLAKKAKGATEFASKHSKALKTIGAVALSAVAGITSINLAMSGFTKAKSAVAAVKGFGTAISGLTGLGLGPIGLIAGAIAGVGAGFIIAYKKVKPFREGVNSLVKVIGNSLKPTLKAISPVAKTIGNVLGKAFTGFFTILGNGLKWLTQTRAGLTTLRVIGTAITLPFKALGAVFKIVAGGAKAIAKLFNGDFKGAMSVVGSGAKAAGNAFKKGFGAITKSAKSVASKAGKSIKSFANGLGKKLSGGTGKASKVFSKFTGAISKGAKKLSKSSNKIFASMGKKVSSIFSKMSKSAKKSHDKMAKDGSKGMQKTSKATIKQAQKMAKDVQKQFNNLKKTSQKLFKSLPKDAQKVFKKVTKQVNKGNKNISKKLKALDKSIKSFDKKYDKTFKALGNTTDKFTRKTKKDLKSIDKLVKDGTRWQKALEKNTEGLSKSIRKVMASIQKEWDKSWDFIADSSHRAFDKVYKDEQKVFVGQVNPSIKKTNNDILNNFKSTFDQVSKASNTFWGNLKKQAGSGFNGIIDVINQGVSGINSLVGSFGGNKNAIGKISPVRYASGTGYFSNIRRPITNPTLAMLNDGDDSPETGHQETVILPNGQMVQPQGRNVVMPLPAGSEVLNATETRLLGLSRFASGTGLFSYLFNQAQKMSVPSFNSQTDDGKQKMVDYIGDAVDKTKEKFGQLFNPAVDKFGGFFKEFQHAIAKPVDSEGQKWYSALFKMAQEKLGSINAAAGMIGDDYPANLKAGAVWSSTDPWGYFVKECVSFVAARLNNLGVNPALFSHLGNGNEWISARVPHVAAKPGTVAVYSHGGQNHVSYVTAVHDGMFDGEEYNWMNAHSYHQYTNRPLSMATAFLDFGVKVKTKEEENAEFDKNLDARQKLAKQQTDPMMKWIEDNLAEFSGGGMDNPGGAGVERWRPYVIKALKANGLDPTEHRVSSMLRLIQRESNGDPNVANGWDSNAAAGNPSIGLTQTTISTFNSNKHKGHDNIRNGYDNLLASIRYIIGRYGTSDAVFTRVADYAYANGGLVSANGLYELAEGNRPEYVIPTDIAKRGRAKQLLNEVKERFAKDTPSEATAERRSSSDDKIDQVIGLLQNLLAATVRGSQTVLNIDGKKIAEIIAPFSTEANNKFNARQKLIKGF